jgi:hypothetical protein
MRSGIARGVVPNMGEGSGTPTCIAGRGNEMEYNSRVRSTRVKNCPPGRERTIGEQGGGRGL